MREPTGSDHQNSLVQGRQEIPHRRAQRAAAVQRPQRHTDGVDEDRNHRTRSGVTEQLLQRLYGAVIHVHAGRHRDVDTRAEHGFRAVGGDVFGYIERAEMRAIVANSAGVQADTERRHHLIEEPVVVIGGKYDDELGVEFLHEPSRLRDCAVYVVKQILRRPR